VTHAPALAKNSIPVLRSLAGLRATSLAGGDGRTGLRERCPAIRGDAFAAVQVSTANGPRAFGSGALSAGHQYTRRFNVPGAYQLFCYLHPITMHQEVVVRPTRVAAASSHRDATGNAGVEEDFY